MATEPKAPRPLQCCSLLLFILAVAPCAHAQDNPLLTSIRDDLADEAAEEGDLPAVCARAARAVATWTEARKAISDAQTARGAKQKSGKEQDQAATTAAGCGD